MNQAQKFLLALPITNILLTVSRIQEHLAAFHEHFAHLNGHHN